MKQIPCLKHEGSYLLFIKSDIQKSEYVCEECCMDMEKQNIKVELSKLIHIKNALKSPEFLLSKLNSSAYLSGFFAELDRYNEKTMTNILNGFKVKVLNIQSALQEVYKELESHTKCFLEMKYKIREELKKIINFDQFIQFTVNLEQLGDSINPKAIEQNEKILHQYIQELTKNECRELNKTLVDMLGKILRQPKDLKDEQYPQYLKFEEEFKTFNTSQIEFAKQINLGNFNSNFGVLSDGKLLSQHQIQKIMNIIETKLKKKIIGSFPIYRSIRDGLNQKYFWNKVNNQSNLLMIFKSKSGYIFGGFSPCQWQQNLNNYVQDNTMSSFIFSQTHDQIYYLKDANKAQAIYCHQSNGPIFGSNDMQLGADFQSGQSNLGTSYQCDQYQTAAKNTQLFGQTTPNLAECEIYQIILS
ncbi:unnamed protein product (macronuclear) [Paramecium tetraurelia]|uniref:TLDc domain-containing protein n=1 Tax=Paramecium tetraurelia TaxID=5888 RepID=A0BY76_PARTE|nr:uncharacterized protein GSPATT00033346001 [Paramecium tetraurelia]CAK63493.1 unnamed protein product [Paramecium tetraurelia]|eukprot:XP_001430891.1 hypothetical protein (macronuclear) [Paramecium tetraurelia strain d4-2]